MAIHDRNPDPGTTLWARYKGSIHAAYVVVTWNGLRFRRTDRLELMSPSAAASGITTMGANGLGFWSGGEPGDPIGPGRTSPANRAVVHIRSSVPMPEPSRRGEKPAGKAMSKTGDHTARETSTDSMRETSDATTTDRRDPPLGAESGIECHECGGVSPATAQTSRHLPDVDSA